MVFKVTHLARSTAPVADGVLYQQWWLIDGLLRYDNLQHAWEFGVVGLATWEDGATRWRPPARTPGSWRVDRRARCDRLRCSQRGRQICADPHPVRDQRRRLRQHRPRSGRQPGRRSADRHLDGTTPAAHDDVPIGSPPPRRSQCRHRIDEAKRRPGGRRRAELRCASGTGRWLPRSQGAPSCTCSWVWPPPPPGPPPSSVGPCPTAPTQPRRSDRRLPRRGGARTLTVVQGILIPADRGVQTSNA
jgi:hypothetical protein